MIRDTFKCLGLALGGDVPASMEEYNTLAKRTDVPNACLSDAIDNTVYRGPLAKCRWAFVSAIDADVTIGVRMQRKTVKNSEGVETEVVDESEARFFKRVCAHLNLTTPEAIVARFQPLMTECEKHFVFDPSVREPSERTPSISKAVKATVDSIVAKGEKAMSKAAARLTKIVGFEVQPNAESLTKGVAVWEKAEQEKQRLAREAQRNDLLGV